MSKMFWVKSMVRSVHTRLLRAQSPERPRFKQYILGGSLRLVRGRPICVAEEQFNLHKDELEAKWRSGILEVRVDSPEGPVHDFKKPRKRRTSTPPPPPKPPQEEPVELEEPITVEEPYLKEEGDEFVPVEEFSGKKRGRKQKRS